jgi:hypothetical protein
MNLLISSPESGQTGFIYLTGGYRMIYGRCNSRISLLEAATNVLYLFNLSPTMVWQGGHGQLEQSNMFLTFNMAKMANDGISLATREDTHYLIQKPRT